MDRGRKPLGDGAAGSAGGPAAIYSSSSSEQFVNEGVDPLCDTRSGKRIADRSSSGHEMHTVAQFDRRRQAFGFFGHSGQILM